MADNPKKPVTVIDPRARPEYQHNHEAWMRAAANGGEGWVYWQDNAKLDRANGITIADGTRTLITIDGDGPDSTDELDSIPRPDAGKALLSNNRFMPVELNDNYLIRFGFSAAMVDPGLSNTEETNSIQIEFDVGGLFNVHEATTIFNPDPGPMRREVNHLSAINLGFTLPITGISARITLINGYISTAVSEHNSTGQKFIEFGQAFAGQPVVDNGVAFYVTPSTDIILWAPDVTITRLSSPTL